MTREDEDKMYADQYRYGPKGRPETVEQAIARAERSESQLRIVGAERDALRAQVAKMEAQTACARWAKVDSSAATVRLVLAAMDGAKP